MNLRLNNTVIKNLTANELNILQFIYKNPVNITDMSIQEFAAAVSYSTATVLRFCKKLGYSGFAELKYALRDQLKTPSAAENTAAHDRSIHQILGALSSDIENTARLIQEEQLYPTFRLLDAQCSIYLWAPGGVTSVLTDYFEKLLFSIGRQKVYKIDAFRIGEHILNNLHEKAVLIVISVTGNFAPTVNLVRLARANDIAVLSITPCSSNTIADDSTVSFRFFTNQRENQGAEFTSRLPVFFIIQFIIHAYLHYRQLLSAPAEINSVSSSKQLNHLSLPLFDKAHSLSLTQTEQQLLEYMENHLSDCAFFNLKDLESRLYTSSATIVRFCQKLGLRGFHELKYQIRSQLSRQQDTLFFTHGLISHSIALFHDNLQTSDLASLQAIADLMASDRPVYIYGNERNSAAAKYLHIILTALDYPSILLEWPDLLYGLSYEMSSQTILFLLTAHENALSYTAALEKAKQQGICSILLTCEADNPLFPLCDYVLYSNDRQEEYRHVDVSSRFGMLTIIQLLIELLVRKL